MTDLATIQNRWTFKRLGAETCTVLDASGTVYHTAYGDFAARECQDFMRWTATPECPGGPKKEPFGLKPTTLTEQATNLPANYLHLRNQILDQLQGPNSEIVVFPKFVAKVLSLPCEVVKAILLDARNEGLATFGVAVNQDTGTPCGSGYMLTSDGEECVREALMQ